MAQFQLLWQAGQGHFVLSAESGHTPGMAKGGPNTATDRGICAPDKLGALGAKIHGFRKITCFLGTRKQHDLKPGSWCIS